MLRTIRVAAAIGFVIGWFNPAASAQTIGVERAERLPLVTFGAGVGPLGNGELSTSIVAQGFLTRGLVFQVDGIRWGRDESRVVSTTKYGTQTFHRHRSGWAAGASLLFRTKPGRVSWFGGGGIAVLETVQHDRYAIEGCVPPPSEPRLCDHLAFSTNNSRDQQTALRLMTGADVRIAGPVSAYGLVEFTGLEGLLRFSGGARVAAFSRDVARTDDEPLRRLRARGVNIVPLDRARGKKVQVLFVSGSQRTGVLMDLTATDVAVRESGSAAIVRYPLEQLRLVKIVRTTPLKAGLIGFGAGAGAGFILCLSNGGDAIDGLATAPLLGAMTGAGSALVAALLAHSQAASNVVWIEKKRTVSVAPILSPTMLGVGGAIRW